MDIIERPPPISSLVLPLLLLLPLPLFCCISGLESENHIQHGSFIYVVGFRHLKVH